MSEDQTTLRDRLEDILESINLIQEWTAGRKSVNDYLTSSTGMMAFNASVMRLQVIGEHIGRLLKSNLSLLNDYPQIPWHAIYGLRNFISHEYANIDEEIIVSTINNDLQPLKGVIEDMLKR